MYLNMFLINFDVYNSILAPKFPKKTRQNINGNFTEIYYFEAKPIKFDVTCTVIF